MDESALKPGNKLLGEQHIKSACAKTIGLIVTQGKIRLEK